MSTTLIAIKPTPLLNTPDFKATFGSATLPLDEKGLLRSVEMVAFPGTKFQLLRFIDPYVAEVTTKDYPQRVYLDMRFVCHGKESSPDRQKILPPHDVVLSRLQQSIGLPYVWGGNWGKGIPEIRAFYQPHIPPSLEKLWTLAGVDCSGLLYEATSGYTPRNTSELVSFGKEIPPDEELKPLDILVWPGHVIIIFDKDRVIESTPEKGVSYSPLNERLTALVAASKKFSIRRFN